MVENKEISALFHLIDDPDEEVFITVSDRIISFGKGIIPNLENLWENTHNTTLQERIELLIHQLHFRDLTEDFMRWKQSPHDLLQGALLTARYHYPDLQPGLVYQEIEKMRRNIWLELNNYLTPLEQVTIVSSILYNYHKLKGVELAYNLPEEFLINKTLETKKGNAISNGILYLVLCELLDLPVKAVSIPRQFILAYFDTQLEFENPDGTRAEKISFYIDPVNGQVYSHQDVDNYFKRLNTPPESTFFKPLNNTRVIRFLVDQLSRCFDNDANAYKMQELLSLVNLLDE